MKLKIIKKLQRFFNLNEFLSNNDPTQIGPIEAINVKELSDYLQKLREILSADGECPIDINSGYRSPKYNASLPVPGSKNSYHLQGLAADIKFDWTGWTRRSLTKVLKYIGFTNVNFYWNSKRDGFVWLHVDIGPAWNGKDFNYRDLDAITHKEIEVKW